MCRKRPRHLIATRRRSRQVGRRCRAGARMLAGVTGTLTSLALIVVFVTIGGFFSGSELAVLTLRESQVERLPGRRGERVRRLRLDPSRFLASVQVGVTFAGFFASAYGGATLSEPLGRRRSRRGGCPRAWRRSVAFVVGHGVRVVPLARAGRARAQAHRPAARGGHRAHRLAGARGRRVDRPPRGVAAVAHDEPDRADARVQPAAGRRGGHRGGAARPRQHPPRPRRRGTPGAHRRVRRGQPPARGRDGAAHRGGVPRRRHAPCRRPPARCCRCRTRATR